MPVGALRVPLPTSPAAVEERPPLGGTAHARSEPQAQLLAVAEPCVLTWGTLLPTSGPAEEVGGVTRHFWQLRAAAQGGGVEG